MSDTYRALRVLPLVNVLAFLKHEIRNIRFAKQERKRTCVYMTDVAVYPVAKFRPYPCEKISSKDTPRRVRRERRRDVHINPKGETPSDTPVVVRVHLIFT